MSCLRQMLVPPVYRLYRLGKRAMLSCHAVRIATSPPPYSSAAIPSLAVLVLLSAMACGEPRPEPASPPPPNPPAPEPGIFVDRAAEAGLDFVHFNGMSGRFYMAEVTGAGGAMVDVDNDGDLDLFLVQGNMLGPGRTLEDALFPPRHPAPLTDRLYRNESSGPNSPLRFIDITEKSGLGGGYGMGVASGDIDNDGWTDLYVTRFGSNQLLRNRGDGTFEDITDTSGTDDRRWSVPAAFFDYDRDGWLDLFIGNYIAADLANPKVCSDLTGSQDYCGPGAYPAEPDRLLRNRRDGTFEDVSRQAGLRGGFGGALGVVAADWNGDGWTDLYVANDGTANNLWMNQGDGTFQDEALLAGVSVNAGGQAEASMGLDTADFDADGDFDLFMAHLVNETNTLYRNDGRGLFVDTTDAVGLGAPSRPFTSFGALWIDTANSGWLDLLVVSGAVKKIEALARAQDPFPLHQPNQLFRNLQGRRFVDASGAAGAAIERSEVSRGLARGDIDNDGDQDVLVANNNGPARLLINTSQGAHWIGLRLVGGPGGRDMLGARVAIDRPGAPTLWRRVATDGGYCSANDPRAHFGLGENGAIDRVRVYWIDQTSEQWTDLPIDRYSTLRQGEGSALSP